MQNISKRISGDLEIIEFFVLTTRNAYSRGLPKFGSVGIKGRAVHCGYKAQDNNKNEQRISRPENQTHPTNTGINLRAKEGASARGAIREKHTIGEGSCLTGQRFVPTFSLQRGENKSAKKTERNLRGRTRGQARPKTFWKTPQRISAMGAIRLRTEYKSSPALINLVIVICSLVCADSVWSAHTWWRGWVICQA